MRSSLRNFIKSNQPLRERREVSTKTRESFKKLASTEIQATVTFFSKAVPLRIKKEALDSFPLYIEVNETMTPIIVNDSSEDSSEETDW
jgi:hypothetical protein